VASVALQPVPRAPRDLFEDARLMLDASHESDIHVGDSFFRMTDATFSLVTPAAMPGDVGVTDAPGCGQRRELQNEKPTDPEGWWASDGLCSVFT
jgi:hypothetical protein